MPTISIEVSAANQPRVVSAAARGLSRVEGESDGALVKRWIITFIKEQVQRDERQLAADAVASDEEIAT
jgi:hypothetical protein